jgi:hypothetical protein
MLRNYYAALAGLVLLSHSASAVQADQQWRDWYGNISAKQDFLNLESVSMVRTILWMKRPLLR